MDWTTLYRNDSRLPAGTDLEAVVDALAECLRDPDPEVRDGDPHCVLATLIERDEIAGELRLRLGDLMAERFHDSEIQARTFAPLVLVMIVERGDLKPAWVDAFADWFVSESDLRGHDRELGWLHAVAHGADLLGAVARHPAGDPQRMLRLAAARLIAPTEEIWREREEHRLADAVAAALRDERLTTPQRLGWLDTVAAAFRAVPHGPTPPFASNALRTLAALHLRLAASADIPDAAAVQQRIIEVVDRDAALVG